MPMLSFGKALLTSSTGICCTCFSRKLKRRNQQLRTGSTCALGLTSTPIPTPSRLQFVKSWLRTFSFSWKPLAFTSARTRDLVRQAFVSFSIFKRCTDPLVFQRIRASFLLAIKKRLLFCNKNRFICFMHFLLFQLTQQMLYYHLLQVQLTFFCLLLH